MASRITWDLSYNYKKIEFKRKTKSSSNLLWQVEQPFKNVFYKLILTEYIQEHFS